jgi:hypothetical protein
MSAVSYLMEHYGYDAVSKIEIEEGVLATSDEFVQTDLSCLDNWEWIYKQAEGMMDERKKDREKEAQKAKGKKR